MEMFNFVHGILSSINFFPSFCVIFILGQMNDTLDLPNFSPGHTPIVRVQQNDRASISASLDLGCESVVIFTNEPSEALDNLHLATKKSGQRKHRKVVMISQGTDPREILNLDVLGFFANFALGLLYEDKITFWRQKFSGSSKEVQNEPVLIDVWKNESFLFGNNNLFPEDWRNLRLRKLRMATFNYPPYSIIEGNQWDGTEMKLAIELARKLNFTWQLVTDSSQWGQIFENSTGDGILGNVAGEKADFGFGAIYLWYNEYQHLDFTVPYIRTGITCLAPRPKLLSGLMAPALPFSNGVWTLVGSSIVAGAFVLWLMAKKLHRESRLIGFVDCTLTVLGFMLMVPAPKMPPGVVKICLIFFSVQGLLLATSYSSSLISVMTVPRFGQPLDTPKQMAEIGYAWAANHDAWAFSLRDATDNVYARVYKQFRIMNEEEQQAAALKGARVAFAVERLPSGQLAANTLLSSAVDKLRLMREDLYWEMVVSVLRKGSYLTDTANDLALQLQQSGLLLHWEERAAHKWDLAAVGLTQQATGPTNLKLTHLAGVFALWALAILVSAFVFVCEVAACASVYA